MTKESPTPSERAEFEAWAVNERKWDVSRYKSGMQGYRYSAAANGWRAWSAARASVSEDAARYQALRLEAPTILSALEDEWDFFGDPGKQLDDACDRAIAAKRKDDAARKP